MKKNAFMTIPSGSFKTFSSFKDRLPSVFCSGQVFYCFANIGQIGFLVGDSNDWETGFQVKFIDVYNVEPSKCYAIEHDYSQLFEVR